MGKPKLERIHHFIGQIQRYGVLFTPVSIIVVFLSYKTQTYNTAWSSISSARESTVDGGRREALKYLKASDRSLQGASLNNSILSYADLENADLNRSELIYADLFGADLRNASLWGANMEDANLQFAQLQGANLLTANLSCADLRGAHLEGLGFPSTVSEKGYTILQSANLQSAHLEGADLRNANLKLANLKHADLSAYKDRFKKDALPSPEKRDPCKRDSTGLMDLVLEHPGVEPSPKEVCEWTRKHPTPSRHIQLPHSFSCPESPKNAAADLTSADLTDADLTGANLTGANLTGAFGTTAEQINAAAYMCNTILPDGTTSYRDCPEHGHNKSALRTTGTTPGQ